MTWVFLIPLFKKIPNPGLVCDYSLVVLSHFFSFSLQNAQMYNDF